MAGRTSTAGSRPSERPRGEASDSLPAGVSGRPRLFPGRRSGSEEDRILEANSRLESSGRKLGGRLALRDEFANRIRHYRNPLMNDEAWPGYGPRGVIQLSFARSESYPTEAAIG